MQETFYEVIFSDMYGDWVAWLTPEKYEVLDSTVPFFRLQQNATFMVSKDSVNAVSVNPEDTIYKMILRLSSANIVRTNLKKYDKFSIWQDVNRAIEYLKIIQPPFTGNIGDNISMNDRVIFVEAGSKSGRTTYIQKKIADNPETYGLYSPDTNLDKMQVVFIEGHPSNPFVRNMSSTYPDKIFVVVI